MIINRTLEESVKTAVQTATDQGCATVIITPEGLVMGPTTSPDSVWTYIFAMNLNTFALHRVEPDAQGLNQGT
jgi:hypothetical protein